jgi:hypothetical protein
MHLGLANLLIFDYHVIHVIHVIPEAYCGMMGNTSQPCYYSVGGLPMLKEPIKLGKTIQHLILSGRVLGLACCRFAGKGVFISPEITTQTPQTMGSWFSTWLQIAHVLV